MTEEDSRQYYGLDYGFLSGSTMALRRMSRELVFLLQMLIKLNLFFVGGVGETCCDSRLGPRR